MTAEKTAQEAAEFFKRHGCGGRVGEWWMWNVGVVRMNGALMGMICGLDDGGLRRCIYLFILKRDVERKLLCVLSSSMSSRTAA